MKLNYQRSNETATTLTEVVAAVAILAICAAGLMGALANGFFTMQMTRENQRATQILMEEVELIRLYSWDQINRPGVVPTNFTAVYDPQSANGSGVTYTGAVSIVTVPSSIMSASYRTNMRQVTLSLTWATKKVPRTRSVTTFVSRDGFQNYVY